MSFSAKRKHLRIDTCGACAASFIPADLSTFQCEKKTRYFKQCHKKALLARKKSTSANPKCESQRKQTLRIN